MEIKALAAWRAELVTKGFDKELVGAAFHDSVEHRARVERLRARDRALAAFRAANAAITGAPTGLLSTDA